MKSEGVVSEGGGFFTPSYCNICNAQLISESQRIAHYQSRKHANKVRLFYMLHPEDGGPPSKRLRPDNPDSADSVVDRNKCCTLCNMFFTSAIVAQSHYQGKTHAKRMRLVLGVPADTLPCQPMSPPVTSLPAEPPPANGSVLCRSCCLCGAWFNNPSMAQQHYDGKRHRRNADRARLLEQLADRLDGCKNTDVRRMTMRCSMCRASKQLHLQCVHHDAELNRTVLRSPPRLQTPEQIERTLFEDTVKTLNNYYTEAEKIGGQSYLEGCLACSTAYLIFLCMETRYEKIEISIYEDRGSSGSSSGSSTTSCSTGR